MDQDKPESSTNHGKRTRPLLLQPSPKIARLSAYSSASSSGIPKGSKKSNLSRRPKITYNKSEVPATGTPVPEKHVRKAGPFLLGPKLGPSPVKSIVQCLARKEKTDDFYQVRKCSVSFCRVKLNMKWRIHCVKWSLLYIIGELVDNTNTEPGDR